MFGLDEKGKVRDRFCFPANCLVVTSIDIQSVEPVDQRTRDALQKSVQLAIEITTNSQEAAARSAKEREREGRNLSFLYYFLFGLHFYVYLIFFLLICSKKKKKKIIFL